MEINRRLRALREEMSRHDIDAYIVPTCDFHGSEYIGNYFKTREYITGFTGSAGTAIITQKEALLWTDGRYFIQAEKELIEADITLMREGMDGIPTVLEFLSNYFSKTSTEVSANTVPVKCEKKVTVGFDGRMITSSLAKSIEEICNVKSDVDLIGEIWDDRPQITANPIWKLDEKYAGKSIASKMADIRKMMLGVCDTLILTALDEIAWTLNLRGNDIAHSPVFMSYMAITTDEAIVFLQKKSLNEELIKMLEDNGINVMDYELVYDALKVLENHAIWLDESHANYNIIKTLEVKNEIINKFTPAMLMKAIKNEIEISNMKKAHLLDGIAMTKFIYWLKNNVGKISLDEYSLGEKLEEFRGVAESYIGPSFEPIVGYNENGAIVHYSATKENCKNIEPEGMVLIDSGGHYLEGTTDITRTISLGPVTEKTREMYTAVLRGHLNLTAAMFKDGCSGVALDHLARKPLWDKGMDYNHGTGHGVGYLLNVHEGPNGIRYRVLQNLELNPVFKPGMITSNEPGIYLEGEFGIRIENLILCVEKEENQYGRFLGFEPLTLVPFDRELINIDEMSEEEKGLLVEYNKLVYSRLSNYLTEEEREWVKGNLTLH